MSSKTSSQDVLKTFSRRLQDVFKTCSGRRLAIMSWRRLQYVFKTSWKTKSCYTEDVFITFSPRQMFAGILCRKIKPTALIIWSHENFKLKYLGIEFYCFFIVFWPPLPKVILVLFWGWRQIVQHDMNSHSLSHFIFYIINFEFRVS